MAKRLKETIRNYFLASAISIPLILPINASAEILENKIMNSGNEYNITIDTEKKQFGLNPDIEEKEAREMLASCMLGKLASNIKEKRRELNEKTERFLQENPSEMQMAFSESDLTLKQNIMEFLPYTIPKMEFNSWKKGNEVTLIFGLPSQDFAIDWYKDCSITILYPKDTRLTGRKVDEAYVLGQEQNSLGMHSVEKDNLGGEREAYGMLADAILKKGMEKAESNPLGMVLSAGIRLEDFLAKDEKAKREDVIQYLKGKYNYFDYSPSYFYATPEQKRKISVKFDKNPGKISFFINSNIVLRKDEQGSQSKKEGVLLKLVEINTMEATDETSAGKIIKHSRLLGKRIDDFLSEYENKKQRIDFEEKSSLYEKLGVWNAQIEPFIGMLSKLQNKEIQGNIENLPEFQEFKKDAQEKTEQIVPLRHLVNEYIFISRYSKNDRDKLLELIKREERALKENDLELYLSCLSKKSMAEKGNLIRREFEERENSTLQEKREIGNIFIKGNSALVSVKYTVWDSNYLAEFQYDGIYVKEDYEWKGEAREIVLRPKIIKKKH